MAGVKKLLLILDLDHTLLNSTRTCEVEQDVDKLEQLLTVQHEALSQNDVQPSLFFFSHLQMWTKLRYLHPPAFLFLSLLYTPPIVVGDNEGQSSFHFENKRQKRAGPACETSWKRRTSYLSCTYIRMEMRGMHVRWQRCWTPRVVSLLNASYHRHVWSGGGRLAATRAP